MLNILSFIVETISCKIVMNQIKKDRNFAIFFYLLLNMPYRFGIINS